MSKKPSLDEKWYKEGLRFKCTECGQCCTGAPGYVWLTDEDIERFADHFKLTKEAFLKTYARHVKGRYSLKESPVNYDCVFLNGKRCTVYNARPKQCRKFPFWPANLTSKAAWDDASKYCEGINAKDAPLIPASEIAQKCEE